MATRNIGNWFENGPAILDKTANISTDGGTFTGDVTGDVIGTLSGTVVGDLGEYTTVTPAISLLVPSAHLDATSNAVAATLINGNPGQFMRVTCVNADSAVTLIPTTLVGGTTYTFDVNEYVLLQYDDNDGWNTVIATAALT